MLEIYNFCIYKCFRFLKIRVKKVKNYRFYYLIYDEFVIVFIIALSDKKEQQHAIDAIKSLIPQYRELIKKRLNL